MLFIVLIAGLILIYFIYSSIRNRRVKNMSITEKIKNKIFQDSYLTKIYRNKKNQSKLTIQQKLQIALDNEDYETAAKLRDKMNN